MKSFFPTCILLIATFVGSAQKLPSGPQVLTIFSDADDTEQPYGLYLPKNYDENKKYPLVIMLHGAGSNHRLALRRVFGKSNANGENDVEATRYFPEWKDIDYIVASPLARGTAGYQGIAEKDVYDVLADVKKRFNIDEDRTYLTGLSMGGGGTLWLGMTRPDIWAAIAPVCPAPPQGTIDLAANALNFPLHFYHGDADQAVPVSVSRDWVKKLKELGSTVEYDEYPGVNHDSWVNAYKDEAVFDWFNKFKRNPYPDQVRFNSKNYKYNKAYWIQFDQLTPGTLATIDAKFAAPNAIDITTSGLDAFSLNVTGHPKFTASKPTQVTINGKKIKTSSTNTLSFKIENGKWIAAKYEPAAGAKTIGREGPVSEAFASRHVYVYGTGGNPSEEEMKKRIDIATQAANWSVYRGSFLGRIMFFPRIVADKDIRPSDLESSNLVLFGTKETNTMINKYADQLPLHLNESATQDHGLFYIYPVDNHYIVVSSGLPWWASGTETQRFSGPQAVGGFKDLILFKENPKAVLAEGFFDKDWKVGDAEREKIVSSGVVGIR